MRRIWIVLLVTAVACAIVGTGLLTTPDEKPSVRASVMHSSLRSALVTRGIGSVAVRWLQVQAGFETPTQVTSARDRSGRLFVVEKGGRIEVFRSGRHLPGSYLNLSDSIDTAGEGGLLSVAFSPSFRRDHLLWVAYSRRSDGDLVVGRLRARTAQATHVRSDTLRTVLVVEHSLYDNHYGGQLAFGPDGKLYLGTGDGGGAGDPLNSAGDRRDLRGKILRLDVNRSCGGKRYCVPKGNPFVGREGRNEIWLMGVRNPWRFSFDARTQNLWIGDVGQDRYEEVNRVSQHPQRINLGWSCREGRITYKSERCRSKVDYRAPLTTVRHPVGESITGGFVYRGQKYRRLIGGAYVFSDFISHRVWLYKDGRGKVLQDQRLGHSGSSGATSFGVNGSGEIFAVTYDGVLWRMRVQRR